MNSEEVDRVIDGIFKHHGIGDYKTRNIIQLRYGFGDGYVYTPQEVARIFKLKEEEVSAIEKIAVKTLERMFIDYLFVRTIS